MQTQSSPQVASLVLDDSGKVAFQKYLDLGGNFIGVHAASDCLRTTTFHGNETGILLVVFKLTIP